MPFLEEIAPDLYKAAEIIGRERIGALSSVTSNQSSTTAAAKGQKVKAFFADEPEVSEDYNPSMTLPEGNLITGEEKYISLDTFTSSRTSVTGEESRAIDHSHGYASAYGAVVEKGLRKISNLIERRLCATIIAGAGNAFGTSGVNPFTNDYKELANLHQLLIDRGMPEDGMSSYVMNTTHGTRLRQNDNLLNANTAGSQAMRSTGTILPMFGFDLKESAGIGGHTKGTATGKTVSLAAGYAVGDKVIMTAGGSGAFAAGDVVRFGDNPTKYVASGPAVGGALTLNSGLMQPVADGAAIAVEDSFTGNFALHRGAAEFASRPIAIPTVGDAASERLTIQDPKSGLVYTVAVYLGHQMATMEMGILWGAKVWNPDLVVAHQA